MNIHEIYFDRIIRFTTQKLPIPREQNLLRSDPISSAVLITKHTLNTMDIISQVKYIMRKYVQLPSPQVNHWPGRSRCTRDLSSSSTVFSLHRSPGPSSRSSKLFAFEAYEWVSSTAQEGAQISMEDTGSHEPQCWDRIHRNLSYRFASIIVVLFQGAKNTASE